MILQRLGKHGGTITQHSQIGNSKSLPHVCSIFQEVASKRLHQPVHVLSHVLNPTSSLLLGFIRKLGLSSVLREGIKTPGKDRRKWRPSTWLISLAFNSTAETVHLLLLE